MDRNIKSINELLDIAWEDSISLKLRRDFWVVQTLNNQQREMYSNKIHSCQDRIVSISQAYVRPIVRGKNGKKVEFGTKIGLAQIDEFVKAETLSWDTYNESADLIPHAESYKKLKGYYPELIQVDKIYGTNKNRKWCSERNIRITISSKRKIPKVPLCNIVRRYNLRFLKS